MAGNYKHFCSVPPAAFLRSSALIVSVITQACHRVGEAKQLCLIQMTVQIVLAQRLSTKFNEVQPEHLELKQVSPHGTDNGKKSFQ